MAEYFDFLGFLNKIIRLFSTDSVFFHRNLPLIEYNLIHALCLLSFQSITSMFYFFNPFLSLPMADTYIPHEHFNVLGN